MNNRTHRSSRFTRWADFESNVMVLVDPQLDGIREIKRRQTDIDDDADEAALVLDQFEKELNDRRHVPATSRVFIPSRETAEWLSNATRTHWPSNRATAHLKSLAISELQYTKRRGKRGWIWTGANAIGKTVRPLKQKRHDSDAQ